jgi:hypothetical protein
MALADNPDRISSGVTHGYDYNADTLRTQGRQRALVGSNLNIAGELITAIGVALGMA